LQIHLTETKNGDERLVPFNGEIDRLFREQLKKTKEGYLFNPKRGKSAEWGFRIAFDRACKRLDVKGLCFHDFRHTAITNMRKAGVDTSVIMAISGHKTVAMFQRYNKVDLGDKMEALSILNHYLGERYEPHALTD
jgi:integrase